MGNWLVWVFVGIFFMLGGLFALLNPFAATLTVEQVAGWLFLFGGGAQIVAAFRTDRLAARILNIVLALAYLWLGVSLLANPLGGILTLTALVAIIFLVNGILKVLLAFGVRGTGYFWPILLSGAISAGLALMVFTNFPQAAAVLLGLLLAVELLSSGAMMIAYALFLRTSPAAEAET